MIVLEVGSKTGSTWKYNSMKRMCAAKGCAKQNERTRKRQKTKLREEGVGGIECGVEAWHLWGHDMPRVYFFTCLLPRNGPKNKESIFEYCSSNPREICKNM